MAQSDKISLLVESEENIDVFSEELESALQVNDFVSVENTNPKIRQQKDDNNVKERSEILNISTATVEPYESFKDIKHSNEKKTDGEAVVTKDLDKELLVDQQYWKQHGTAPKKMNKSKHPTSRMTLKEHKIIDKTMTTPRHPSSYHFGKATTDILEMFLKKKYAGPYLNVAGRGLNSVVIYSHFHTHVSHMSTWITIQNGTAVKVHKLSCDVRKNSTILKKAQKEYEHLEIVKYYSYVPIVFRMEKNVIIMEFIGVDQKPAPSINTVPLERSKEIYDIMVAHLHLWYERHIVHGKLSSKCIRIYRDMPYVLGWSHSVGTEHPQALKKLMRDCYFVTEFFKRRGVAVKSIEELFISIWGVKLSRTLLDELYGKKLWQDQDHHLSNPNRTSDGHCKPNSTSRFKA